MRRLLGYITRSTRNKEDKILFRRIKRIVGFYPSNLSLYKISLTHKSSAFIDKNGKSYNNERLEFLGDAVLSHIIARFLFRRYAHFNEGQLTKTRSKIVSGKALASFSDQLGITPLIYSDNSIEKIPKKIKEDAFEAFVGAIYLDAGFSKTERFILNRVLGKHVDLEQLIRQDDNFKSQIIEWAQKHHYSISFDTHSIDKQRFKADVLINGDVFGSGTGLSKKEAEQRAASQGMENVQHYLTPN